MQNERICFIGGSGSLGTEFVNTFIKHNAILIVSRNEDKQWQLRQQHSDTSNLSCCIGDIIQYQRFKQHIYDFQPTIIIYAAALKHVDNCEKQIDLCVGINYQGMHAVVTDIQCQRTAYPSLKTVVFISTDKACLPITVYGQTKALTEKLLQTTRIPGVKCVTVRYGNVLNSNGSILPILHRIGQNPTCTHFNLTHRDMTRFLMRLQDSVQLIEYAIHHGQNNEIIVPSMPSCRIADLLQIVSKHYGKPVCETDLRCVEKLHEDLVSPYEVPYTYTRPGERIHISPFKQSAECNISAALCSVDTLVSAVALKAYLLQYKYIL